MVVNRQATRRFLARKLRDSSKVKKLSRRRLYELVRERVGIRPGVFHTKPRKHQLACFLLGAVRGSYLYLADMGLGKSKICLDLVLHYAEPALVLVPNTTNVEAWREEASIHAPSLEVVGLDHGGREDKRRMLGEGDLVVVTYQGLLSLASPGAGARKVDRRLLESLCSRFGVVVFDECSALKNHRSKQFGLCRRLVDLIPHRFGLTGTPFDKSPSDLWAQFFLVDDGYALGETLGLFRSAFFTEKPRYWGGVEYEFLESLRGELSRHMRHCSIRYTTREVMDLPKLVGGIDSPMYRPVVLPPSAWDLRERLLRDWRGNREDEEQKHNIYSRMRQLSSGYLKLGEEEGTLVFPENPKLEALVELLRELPTTEKAVVVTIFHKSGDLVMERLAAEGIPAVRIYGKTKNRAEALRAFTKGKARVLVGSESIAFGLNLQRACRYMMFFESPDSSIKRRQIERRIYRIGQERRVYIYDLVVKGTLDRRIIESVQSGKRLFDLLVNGDVRLEELLE